LPLHKHGIHRNTVRDILARYAATGSPMSGSRGGRPRCTTEAIDTVIAVEAIVHPFTSPRKIARSFQLECGRRTVDRRLNEAGLLGRVARHKRDYKPAEVEKRLQWAGDNATRD